MTQFIRYSKDNSNEATLKALTTTSPMTAKAHAALAHQRIERRRTIETAKELKKASQERLW